MPSPINLLLKRVRFWKLFIVRINVTIQDTISLPNGECYIHFYCYQQPTPAKKNQVVLVVDVYGRFAMGSMGGLQMYVPKLEELSVFSHNRNSLPEILAEILPNGKCSIHFVPKEKEKTNMTPTHPSIHLILLMASKIPPKK